MIRAAYNVECDFCRRMHCSGYWAVSDISARDLADEDGWVSGGGRDCCPKCWEELEADDTDGDE